MASDSRRSIQIQLDQLQDSLLSVYWDEMIRVTQQDHQQRVLAIETLTWLYFAQRPLGSKELVDVLGMNVNISAILESCNGLVLLDVTTNDISFMHY
jgi:hypothetical protein